MKFKTILIDPPWEQSNTGKYKIRPKRVKSLPYPTMSYTELLNLPIKDIANIGCHLWLWTTNQQEHNAFHLMDRWEFKRLTTLQWIKPSGLGNWFIIKNQPLLFGYYQKCMFNKKRYEPNLIFAPSQRHSKKPENSYELIERVSEEPRIELFSREKREGWIVLGNEIDGLDIKVSLKEISEL